MTIENPNQHHLITRHPDWADYWNTGYSGAFFISLYEEGLLKGSDKQWAIDLKRDLRRYGGPEWNLLQPGDVLRVIKYAKRYPERWLVWKIRSRITED